MAGKVKIIKSKYNHQLVVAKQGGLSIRKKPITKPYTLLKTANQNEPIGYIIGITDAPLFGYWWYALIPAFPTSEKAIWVAAKYVKPVTTKKPTKKETENLIAQLVENDQKLYQQLIVLGAMLQRLKASGKQLPEIEKKYNKLVTNLSRRQNKLKNSDLIQTKSWIDQKWENLKKKFGLGIAPLVVGIVGAVVGIVASVALYYMFKPDYDESTKDLKVSKQLKKVLDTLPENERKAIEKDLEKQIDQAYNAGKFDGAVGSIWNTVKYVGIAVGGFIVLPKIVDSLNKHR